MEEPVIQGIINVTPDSFYDGGLNNSEDQLLASVKQMIEQGVAIIDVGGQSTRPDAEIIDKETEINRVVPAIKLIRAKFPEVVISVDTFRADVAEKAVENGANIINDVSGGRLDEKMFETVGKLRVPYVLMHSRGDSTNMQHQTDYEDFLLEITGYFEERIAVLQRHGVTDIILDPGFGFAKTVDQNYYLMKHLEVLHIFELPILVGVSRKSMIYNLLKITANESLNGTSVLNTFALEKGASILRVHDVEACREVITIHQKLTHASL